MKKLLLIVLGFILVISSRANQGGPDQFGYTWKDNNQAGGPTYQWVDIVSLERKITGLADDNNRGPFYIGTSVNDYFTYYWYPVDQLWIGSNGYIAFNNINLASVFPSIPDSLDNKHNFISALLSDLTFSGTGNPGTCYLRVSNDSVVISFINVPFYAQNPPYWTGSNTFQIILDKTDKSITINYQSQSGTAMTSTDVKAGMENNTGTIGLQVFSGVYPAAGYCVKYYYPTTSTYYVRDGAVRYNSIPYSRGLFLPYPGSFTLNSNIVNMGNLNILPTFTANATVKNSTGGIAYYDVFAFIDTLFIQQDSTITFSSTLTTPAAGTYSYITRLFGIPNDAVANNDSVVQELVVVDTSQSQYTLAYCDNTPEITGISWVDGTGGVGVYFEPPSYPVKINNIQFYVLSNTGIGCFIKIYDDNGPGGGPGTLLDSAYVVSPVAGVWTTVSYTNPLIIYNGGFYVSWEMNGVGITLALDKTPPVSHRTFEVISGSWAEYRDGLTQDFMIKCQLQKTSVQDMGTASIISPLPNSTISSATLVACYLKNFGQVPLSNFPVRYKFPGQSTVTQNYSGTAIQPGDSVQFSFNTLFYPTATLSANLCIWTGLLYDADQGNDTSCVFITTDFSPGIKDTAPRVSLTIYPNPFSGSTKIEFPNPARLPVFLKIFDVAGRIIREEKYPGQGNINLDRGKMSAGIYILQITAGQQQYIDRLVVE